MPKQLRIRTDGPREFRIIAESKRIRPSVALPPRLRACFEKFSSERYRSFPWRDSEIGAFGLLIAEVLLRQTKGDDVVGPWLALMARYPDASRLSRAREATLKRILQPLGLQNQRARALREIATALVAWHQGQVPTTLQELLLLPHVGMYAASAVSCFAFGERLPIVDTNVLRVFRRISGVTLKRDLRRSLEAWSLAWSILPRDATKHNYGMLDFSALICTPRNPKCEVCELRAICAYGLLRGRT
jgi:A/G-specific adenine glycosylase